MVDNLENNINKNALTCDKELSFLLFENSNND